MDIDASISFDPINLTRFLSVMKQHKMVPRVPVPAEDILGPKKRKKMIHEKGALVFTFIDASKPYKVLDIFKVGQSKIRALTQREIDLKRKVQPPRDKD